MIKAGIRDMAASVRALLLNLARRTGKPYDEILVQYVLERYLFRLSKSDYKKEFWLKGGLLLMGRGMPQARPTRDIDFLACMPNDVDAVSQTIRTIGETVFQDGMVYDFSRMTTEIPTPQSDYSGMRLKFSGWLGKARVPMQIDIGFGDKVVPDPVEMVFPTLLDTEPPIILGYSPETVIAEKFEAALDLGDVNSRMKDFYDIWLLSRSFDFEERTLAEAIRLTFERRGTELTTHIPAFSDRFAEAKRAQWNAFVRRIQRCGDTPDFGEVTSDIAHFLSPVMVELQKSTNMQRRWKPPGPWR